MRSFAALLGASFFALLPLAAGAQSLTPAGTLTPGAGIATWLATPSGANLASALTSALTVGKGGTGSTTLTGHGVVTMNAGGTAQTTVAPGANNNCLVSNGTDWASTACPGGGGGVTTNGTNNNILTSDGAGSFGTPIVPATGIATFLTTPTSANLRAALTDEAGTGVAYFVGGALGTPASGTATNLTGLPLAGIASITANSVAMNATGSSASPTAVAIPACADSGGNHLNYASGTFSCGTSSSGSGTPGGSSGQLQYNNSGAFGGATLGSGLDLTGGVLSLVMVPNEQSGASYTVLSTDANKTVRMTNVSATTVNLTAAATLGANFGIYLECDAGCTIDPDASETVNGASTLVLAAHQKAEVSTDGTVWRAGILPALDPSNGANLSASTVTSAKLASKSGDGTTVVTTTGAQTSGKCVTIDANGNHVADTVACGGGSGGGFIGFNTTSGTVGTSTPYVGPAYVAAAFGTTRPWVAPQNVTISGLKCWMNGGPGAGVTVLVTATIGAGGSGTGVDNTNQQVQLSGTTNGSTTVTDTGIALSAGDVLAMHLTVSAGTLTPLGMSCTIKWS